MKNSAPVNTGHTMLLKKKDDHRGAGEVAGGTAAECAAVCCCLPCGVVKLLVLAVYRVPTGLCRKAWLKNKQKKRLAMKKKGLLQQQPKKTTSFEMGTGTTASTVDESDAAVVRPVGDNELADAAAFDREMWGRFGGTGFWRSPSLEEEEKNKTV